MFPPRHGEGDQQSWWRGRGAGLRTPSVGTECGHLAASGEDIFTPAVPMLTFGQ